MRRPRLLLINPNTTEALTRRLAQVAETFVGTRASIAGVTAPFGPPAIESEADLAVAAEAVSAAIAAQPGHDAVIVAAFGDPGLEAARRLTSAPVLGIGEEGFLAAGAAGRRFAVVTIGAAMRPAIERRASALGLRAQIVGVTIVDGRVQDLVADPTVLDGAIVAAASEAAEQGAEAVLVGGAPFAGIGARLGDRVLVPLVDGVTAALETALQRCAVSQFAAR